MSNWMTRIMDDREATMQRTIKTNLEGNRTSLPRFSGSDCIELNPRINTMQDLQIDPFLIRPKSKSGARSW
jgi:hypothetical protein